MCWKSCSVDSSCLQGVPACRSHPRLAHVWRTCPSVIRRGILMPCDHGTRIVPTHSRYRLWNQADADNAENLMSRTGYVIMYAGCPIVWSSRLQTEIALSTAEAEYIALSTALRQVIPMMHILSEISCVFNDLYMPKPDIHCKVFEDNRSAIVMAESTKFSPRTKHIALKYHHFRSYVKKQDDSHLSYQYKGADCGYIHETFG